MTIPIAGAPHEKLRRIYRVALLFALTTALLPAGCCLFDAAMLPLNATAVVVYGAALGIQAGGVRGISGAAACIIGGLTFPIWVWEAGGCLAWLGVPVAPPNATTPAEINLQYAALFGWTGLVFAGVLTAALLSIRPLLLMIPAAAIAWFLCAQSHRMLGWWPLGNLWPSPWGVPAGVLHAGIATSLWVVLAPGAKRVPTAAQIASSTGNSPALDPSS